MKFLHLSDLHLGKSVYDFSMIEDQEYILKSILCVADEEKPQCALISGDIFDRGVAPTEALRLFDDFLVGLTRRRICVFITSGNHDSADRLAFASRLIKGSGVHIAGAYNGNIEKYTLSDEHGEIDIYLLPFIKPGTVRRYFPDSEIATWTDAVQAVLGQVRTDPSRRSVLLAHQFVTGAFRTESEEVNVGGADNIDASAFNGFDYVALGHLHGKQSIGRSTLRYCGSPLKYSFSEANQDKTITLVELGERGKVTIREAPLVPKRDMKEIKGTYNEVIARDFYRDLSREDYFRVTLTDEQDQPDAMAKLRVIYPNLMRLDYDNTRTRTESQVSGSADASRLKPLELFEILYKEQNNQGFSREQRAYLDETIGKVWGEAQ